MNTAPQLLREFALNLSWKLGHFWSKLNCLHIGPLWLGSLPHFWHVSTIFLRQKMGGEVQYVISKWKLGKAEAAPIRCSTAQALSSSQQDNLIFGNPDGISASITRQISKMKAPRAVRRPWWLDHFQPLTDLAAEHVTFDQKSDVEHPKWFKFGTYKIYKWDWTLRLSTSLCRRSIMKPSRRACWLGTKLCPIIRLLVHCYLGPPKLDYSQEVEATNPIRGRGDLRPSWFGWVSQRWAALGIPYDFTVRSVGLGASSIPPLDWWLSGGSKLSATLFFNLRWH